MTEPGTPKSPTRSQASPLGHTTDALMIIDHHGRLVMWNREAENLLYPINTGGADHAPERARLPPRVRLDDEDAAFSAATRTGMWQGEGVWSNGRGEMLPLAFCITALLAVEGQSAGWLIRAHAPINGRPAASEPETLGEASLRSTTPVQTAGPLIPICAHCKQIRTDAGSWQDLEVYLGQRLQTKLTHGICPACLRKIHPAYCDRGVLSP